MKNAKQSGMYYIKYYNKLTYSLSKALSGIISNKTLRMALN